LILEKKLSRNVIGVPFNKATKKVSHILDAAAPPHKVLQLLITSTSEEII
jgi:hypothetical protein